MPDFVDLTHRLRNVSPKPLVQSPNGDIFKAVLAPDVVGGAGAPESGETEIAIKRIRLGELTETDKDKYKKQRDRELKTLQEVNCPHINSILGTCELDNELCIVTQWMEGGNLSNYLKTNPTTTAAFRRKLLTGAARGIMYLHGLPRQILHGDIHSANVLIGPNSETVLVDFGLSKLAGIEGEFSVTGPGGRAGVSAYMAPELGETDAVRSAASDTFAFGCIMYATFTNGKPPFMAYGVPAQSSPLRTKLLCELGPHERRGIPDDLIPVICQCICADPEGRPAMRDVVDALENGWISVETDLAGGATSDAGHNGITHRHHHQQPHSVTPVAAALVVAEKVGIPLDGDQQSAGWRSWISWPWSTQTSTLH